MKTFKLLLAALTLVTVVACGSQKPSEVAIESIELLDEGNITEYVELISGTDQQKQTIVTIFNNKSDEKMKEKEAELGNLKDVKLISEEIAVNGKTCKVKLELTYDKIPLPVKKTVNLVLEDGKWLVKKPTANK